MTKYYREAKEEDYENNKPLHVKFESGKYDTLVDCTDEIEKKDLIIKLFNSEISIMRNALAEYDITLSELMRISGEIALKFFEQIGSGNEEAKIAIEEFAEVMGHKINEKHRSLLDKYTKFKQIQKELDGNSD